MLKNLFLYPNRFYHIMFFIWWSNTNDEHRDIHSEYLFCHRCSSQTKNTYRLYESKLKVYSVIPIHTSRIITVICQSCLLERKLEKDLESDVGKIQENESNLIHVQISKIDQIEQSNWIRQARNWVNMSFKFRLVWFESELLTKWFPTGPR